MKKMTKYQFDLENDQVEDEKLVPLNTKVPESFIAYLEDLCDKYDYKDRSKLIRKIFSQVFKQEGLYGKTK